MTEEFSASDERAAGARVPPPEFQDFCATCGDALARHFTPCAARPNAASVLHLLVRLVKEGKEPAAIRVLARQMEMHADDGQRLVQSAGARVPSPPEKSLAEDLDWWADRVAGREHLTPWEDGLCQLLRKASAAWRAAVVAAQEPEK